VALLAYNDYSNATLTHQAYTNLIKIDGVNYTLGPFGSTYTAAAINATSALNKILMFSQAADDALFAGAPDPAIYFATCSAASDYMHTILNLVYPRGVKTIAVVRNTIGFSTSVWNGMVALMSNFPGMVIVANVTYSPNTGTVSTFVNLIDQLKKTVPQPDLFVSLSLLAEGPNVTLALRQTNYQPKAIAMTSSSIEGNSNYVLGPDQWNVNLNYYDPIWGSTSNYNKAYLGTYQPSTGETSASLYSAGASATGEVFSTAISNAASLAQSDVQLAIQNIGTAANPFQTFYGNVSFNVKGQNIAKEMIVTQIVPASDGSPNGVLEAILVGPEPWNVISIVYPFPYGCNDSAACKESYRLGTINNGSCVYPPKGAKPGSSCKNGVTSLSVSFLVLVGLSLFLLIL